MIKKTDCLLIYNVFVEAARPSSSQHQTAYRTSREKKTSELQKQSSELVVWVWTQSDVPTAQASAGRAPSSSSTSSSTSSTAKVRVPAGPSRDDYLRRSVWGKKSCGPICFLFLLFCFFFMKWKWVIRGALSVYSSSWQSQDAAASS